MLQQNPRPSLLGEPLDGDQGSALCMVLSPLQAPPHTAPVGTEQGNAAPGTAWEWVRLCPCWGGGGGWGDEGMLRHHSCLHSPAPAKSRSPLPPSSLELQHFCPSKVGCSHHGPAPRKTLRAHGSSRRAGSAPRAHCLSLSSFKLFPSLFSPLCGSFDHII